MSGECDKCGEKDLENECNVGEISGNTCEFVMKQLPEMLKGPKFVKTMIEVFTLCISETLKAGYCPQHYKDAIEEVNFLITTDLNVKDE